jgi:S-adenosyl methyltransferase
MILAGAAQILDFTRPVAVRLAGVLHCVPDDDGAQSCRYLRWEDF